MQNIMNLDGAQLLRVCEEMEVVFVWFGGRTVLVLNFELEQIDAFSMGDLYDKSAEEMKSEVVRRYVYNEIVEREEMMKSAVND